MRQGLGPKKHYDISEIDRIMAISYMLYGINIIKVIRCYMLMITLAVVARIAPPGAVLVDADEHLARGHV